MMLASSALGFAPMAPTTTVSTTARSAAPAMETKADLVALANKLNPVVGFWDPMNLCEYDQWSQGEEAAIGFLRHSEIKHGRIAMFAFVGYCVQANGIHWPLQLTLSGVTYEQISQAGFPSEQWDALPTLSKVQILGAISLLEVFGEASYLTEAQGEKHYMVGGKPGFYPSIKNAGVPHPVPYDLYDPFGFAKNSSPEKKARGLVSEINNGRLAMIGIFGFVSASKIPGSVPGLATIDIKSYAGEYMGPFVAGDVSLPFVADMLNMAPKFPF
mmetsp:Transcript_5520/g.12840  ORF Transcript_5520/g.12840 Transcript_5520/m.12840 type:complete len:272 (-) Transcript_5520:304-1119(-)